jgi:amino acid permease
MASKDEKNKDGKNSGDDSSKSMKNREKLQRDKEKNEQKLLKQQLEFPFKTLGRISTIFAILVFVFMFFGKETDLLNSVYYAFFGFTAIYLGMGLIVVLIIYMMAANKRHEAEERRKKEDEERRLEDKRREEELARLESMQNATMMENMRRGENHAT